MKIFAIKENNVANEIGYLFYYEKTKEFYIELLDGLEEWDIPMLLASLYKKGERTIGDYWSRAWVNQRIVPSDRQNIGQILRDNNLKRYDEFDLLCLASGRCEQDDFYITQIKLDDLQPDILERRKRRIKDITIIGSGKAVVFFKDNTVKICEVDISEDSDMDLLTGGYGITLDGKETITSEELYKKGITLQLSGDDLTLLIKENIVNTQEAMRILNCSRQYINELVKRGTLTPIKSCNKSITFLKSDVLSLNQT